ncbi:TonB-dependent receptor [Prevotella sp. PINT]|jgi:TonB-dependent receptor|uniref:TonB-dependent receptor n=1 Tax=Palleniella intestinalis TaxID=2736291 RepID=UPI0015558191|nr:TonB-dependent receptor [Palleniella intestinalis]NPD82164.1 TonB-dependent receptor [Palleniella intestinalis]
MKKVIKAVSLMLMMAGYNSHAFAEVNENVKQGAVHGRVVDSGNQTLPGASIFVENLKSGVVSDVNGFYTLSNLKPGTYTVKVTYVGYKPIEMRLTVPEGKTLERDIVMNDGLELLEVQVQGAFQGQRKAINAQKNNLGITNIVSADQVGKFPDSNIGDALKRISGINVQYDQGEARFGQVRGTSADLSSVTINGNRIPSAEGDTRNVQLDLIPADMIQTIEVSKVVTPDMDGDAIGGSINLVTKNSPYKRTFNATAGSGYNRISGKAQLNLGLTYGDRYFNDRLGMLLSASYQNSPSGSYDTEFMWEKGKDGKVYLSDYQMRRYFVTRERQSYSAAFDFNVNGNNKLTFKSIFNNRNDWENRYRTNIKDLDEDGKGTVRIQTKAGTPDNRSARLERQRTMDFALGGEHLWGAIGMDWTANYAKAIEERPNERYLDFQLKKQKFDIDLSDERRPYAVPKLGSTMVLGEEFSLKELTEQQESIKEEDLKFSANFKASMNNGAKLKFGAKVVRKTKEKDVDFYEYTPTDEEVFMANSLNNAVDKSTEKFMPDAKYQVGVFADKDYVGGLNLNDASQFEKEQVQAELAGNFEARETVTSGYVRFDHKFTPDVNLMAGFRLEHTSLRYTGRNYDDETDVTTKTERVTNSYVNFLPSLLVKWDVNDDFKVRASYTQTLSRPKYSALVPSVNISRGDNEIKIGNSDLKPTLSYNLDLSADYYFKSIGLVSAGMFYKRIDGFIVDQVVNNHEYQGNVYTRFTQPKNAGNATLLGLEFSYQRDFGFISPALKCLGFYGTYTYTHSRVEDFNFEGRENEGGLSLPGAPAHTANASLYFEKGGLNVRLSYNFASAFIDEMGASAFYDRYYDAVNYMDINAGYTFGKNVKTTFYAEASNLLNQPLRYYQGTKDRTMQAEYYGIKVNAGIKVSF